MKTEPPSRPKIAKHPLLQYLPILKWFPRYQFSWLVADLLAGLTIWAVMVPEAMAYAGIVGVPPVIGLYTVIIPPFAYALLGTSRIIVIGPDSATGLISSVTVGGLALSGSKEYLALTSAIALLVGVFFLLFGLLRMGWVANFIPAPVLRGFIQGLVWVTIIGQVPKLLGIEGGSGNFFEKFLAIAHHLPQVNLLTTTLGITSLLLLFLFKKFIPKLPGVLIAVVLAILTVTFLGLGNKGVEVVGTIDRGLPNFTVPSVSWTQLQALVPSSLAIVLLGYAETLGAAKAAAEKTGGEIDPNQELISHGAANFGAAFSSGFLVVGSLSKTSVAMEAGAKTQVASVFCSVLTIFTLLFLMPLFQNLPHATLGAIVIEAMLGLVNFNYFKNLRRINFPEFITAIVAFCGQLIFGVLPGIGLGIVLSILLLVYHSTHPSTAVLGKLPGESMYRDILRHPEARLIPGLLIFRFDSDLVFPSANYFESQLKLAIAQNPTPVKEVLIDGESINLIDITAIEMLTKLREKLIDKGISLSLARVKDSVRDTIRRSGLEKAIGPDRFYERITDGVNVFIQNHKSKS